MDVHAAKLLNVNIAQGESSTTMAMSACTLQIANGNGKGALLTGKAEDEEIV